MIFFMSTHLSKFGNAEKEYREKAEQIQTVDDVLNSIDKSKSVTASTCLIPSLWDRDVLYETHYTYDKTEDEYLTDVFVFDIRWSLDAKDKTLINRIVDEGYVETVRIDRLISVYERKTG